MEPAHPTGLPPQATSPVPPTPRRLPPDPGRGSTWSALTNTGIALFVLIVLAGVSLPPFGTVQVKGAQTRALAQAKQIGLALRLYANDHEGSYPSGAAATSNDAFRVLFPQYLTSETIFGNKLSTYQTRPADNIIAPPERILEPGENVYSLVAGAMEGKTRPDTPLVVTGTDGTGRGTYTNDQHALGNTWEGNKIVVVCLDGTGALATLTGPPDELYLRQELPDGTHRLPLGGGTLAAGGLALLEPAVDTRPVRSAR